MSNWFEVIPESVFTYGEAVCIAIAVIAVAAVIVVSGVCKIWKKKNNGGK